MHVCVCVCEFANVVFVFGYPSLDLDNLTMESIQKLIWVFGACGLVWVRVLSKDKYNQTNVNKGGVEQAFEIEFPELNEFTT